MTIANNSRNTLYYAKESTLGVTPTNKKVAIRYTGESLSYALTKESSQEINPDRVATSMIVTEGAASGDINFEMSYAEYDPFIAGVLQSTFDVFGTNGVGSAHAVTFAADKITAGTATTGANAYTKLKLGQWFTVRNSSTDNDNKLFRVSRTTAPTSTVITLDAGTPATPGAGASTTNVSTSRLTNGSIQSSFSIQRSVTDTDKHFVYRGMTPDSMSLELSTGSISTGSVSFLGTSANLGDASFLTGTVTNSKTYEVVSAVSGSSCALWAGGAPLAGTFVTSISFNYSNSLRQQYAICSASAIGIGKGNIECTLSLEVYFSSASAGLFEQYVQNQNQELAFTAFDDKGNGYVFTVPKANISSFEATTDSSEGDFMASIEVTALLDSGNASAALRKALFIDRIGDAVVA